MKLIQKRLCMTRDIGVQDNLFGGNLLSFLDECGAILASEEMKSKSVVTAHMDEVNFKKPIKVHDTIYISGKVINRGETSLTIYLEVETFNPSTEERVLVCSTKMVFVHVGPDGHSLLW